MFKFKQSDVQIRGHAVEARIYAENPWKNFLPSTGKIYETGKVLLDNVRVETSFTNGIKVPVEYDSMLAKTAAWDSDRSSAVNRLKTALSELKFYGVKNNISFLIKILEHSDFEKGRLVVNLAARVTPSYSDIAKTAADCERHYRCLCR